MEAPMENSVLTKELFEMLEAMAEKHANNLFDAYMRGYRDGQDGRKVKVISTSPAVLPVEPEAVPAPVVKEEITLSEPVKTSRHRRFSREGTKISLVDSSNKKYTFKSKTDAGYFLGRSYSYILGCEKNDWPVKDKKGNVSTVVY